MIVVARSSGVVERRGRVPQAVGDRLLIAGPIVAVDRRVPQRVGYRVSRFIESYEYDVVFPLASSTAVRLPTPS